MSNLGLVLFTAAFVVVGIYFGEFYEKWHIAELLWLKITIAVSAVFIAEYIYSAIFRKKAE